MPELMALITALIIGRLTCKSCIAIRTKATPLDVETAMALIQRVLILSHNASGRCHVCGIVGPVVSF
jgi:hypothetical protein